MVHLRLKFGFYVKTLDQKEFLKNPKYIIWSCISFATWITAAPAEPLGSPVQWKTQMQTKLSKS